MDEGALAGAGHTGDDGEYACRHVDVDTLEVVLPCPVDLQGTGGFPNGFLDARSVVEVAAGEGVARAQPVDGALEDDLATGRTGTGTEVDDVVGDSDRLRLVLHDQHGVALVAQPPQQVVHPLDVVRVQPDRGLVEDVRDVGERGTEVADHLDALRLAA